MSTAVQEFIPHSHCYLGLKISRWHYNPRDRTIWCRECSGKAGCGFCTIAAWPDGFEMVNAALGPLFGMLSDA